MKPQNILVSLDPKKFLKIRIRDPFELLGFTPTRESKAAYVHAEWLAPEQLTPLEEQEDVYMAAGDLWSLGSIVFMLLAGREPFGGGGDEEIFRKIRAAEYTFDGMDRNVSIDAMHFLNQILTLDTEMRSDEKSFIYHTWIQNEKNRNPKKELKVTKGLFELYVKYKFRSALLTYASSTFRFRKKAIKFERIFHSIYVRGIAQSSG